MATGQREQAWMRAPSLPANCSDAAGAVSQAAGSLSQHKRTGHTMGYVITISAFVTIINIVLVSGGLTRDPISPPKRTLKFQRKDMGM